MENTNESVELNLESVQVDAEQAQGESLSALVEDTAGQQDIQNETPPEKEPGWIKGRINKAVEKAIAETEARITKHYEDMLAPIRVSVMERQAQELVDSGEFKSLELAKEYVALKNGVPYQAEQTQQIQQTQSNRDSHGRFTSKAAQQADDGVDQKADMLAKQANKIKSKYGVNVMDQFNSDPDVKQKILSGEWDFYDVLEVMNDEQKRTPTAPVRSSNGGVSQVNIFDMSEAQWKKLNENLSHGRRYDMRK